MSNEQIFKTGYQVITAVAKSAGPFVIILVLACIAFFILRGFALFSISGKLGIKHPAVSFIPIAAEYTVGSVAEKYRKNNGKKSAKLGIILLLFKILKVLAIAVFGAVFVLLIVTVGSYALDAIDNNTEMTKEMFALVTPAVISFFVSLAFSACYTVTFYVCLWRIISIYDHHNATVFTLLSVICRYVGSVVLFVIRNKEPKLSFDDRLGIVTDNEQ